MDYEAAAVEALRKKVEELKNENELLLKTNTRLKQSIEKLKNTTITSSNLNI